MDRESSVNFRRALGAFTTGVAVVTAEDDAGALGLTINYRNLRLPMGTPNQPVTI